MRLGKVFAVLVAATTMAVAHAQMEPGSFIVRHVNSVPALVKQAQTNDVVMDRYMRHFAMTQSEVVSYLSSLQLSTVDKESLFVVYGAPSGGPLRSRLMRVKKGTKVFTDQTGEVVLLVSCGNPVTRGPKVPLDVNRPVANPTGLPMEELRNVPLQAPVSTMENSIVMSNEPIVPDIPIIPVQESDIPIVTSSSNNLGILGILPIIGIITGGDNNNNPPVPEPATMAVIGLGVAGVIARRRKRK